MEMCQANLLAWIWDENRLMTAKLLSRELQVPVNAAKAQLARFVARVEADEVVGVARADLEVMYGLSGRAQGRRVVTLVREARLPAAEAALESVTSKCVEAVARRHLLTDQGVYTANLGAVKAQPHLNTLAAIRDPRCVPRNTDAARRALVPPGPVVQAPPKLTPKVEPPAPTTLAAPAAARTRGGKAAPRGIASLFAQAPKKKTLAAPPALKAEPLPTEPVADEMTTVVKTETEPSPERENRINERLAKVQAQKKRASRPTRSSQPKRRRIQVLADSDSSDDPDQSEEDAPPLAEAATPAPPQARLIESDDDEMIPPTPDQSASTGRRHVKKWVNKTYTDDKGFMVTKREQESCSESDHEADDQPAQTDAQKGPDSVIQDPPVTQKTKKSAAQTSPPKSKQSSIMNFFQKKTAQANT
eukprot:maker-scaffold180_size281610-snap-gene-0.39 protein:Tk11868 transcript:maker-scaffold180_size281610-snap-gene-0.39-mRNA-1 annotation:"hypothetical protein LOTGIDRAFT_231845"